MGKRKAFPGINEHQFNSFGKKMKFFSNPDVFVFEDGKLGTQFLKTGPWMYTPSKAHDCKKMKKIQKAKEVAIPYSFEDYLPGLGHGFNHEVMWHYRKKTETLSYLDMFEGACAARKQFTKMKKQFPLFLKRRYGLKIKKTVAVTVPKQWP